jgi:hypothetical protein
MLRPGSRRGVLSEVGFEQRQYWLEDGQAGRARCFAAFLKPFGKIRIDERKEDDPRCVLDLADHAIDLGRRAHERIDMFDGSDALILRRRGSRGRNQRFAGRVRDQMKMEVTAAQCGPQGSIADGYNERRRLWTGVEIGRVRCDSRPTRVKARSTSHSRSNREKIDGVAIRPMNCGDKIVQ